MAKSSEHLQQSLSEYCRGNSNHAEGLPADRADVYKDLVFNAFDSTLTRAYPIASAILGSARWKELVTDFIGSHPSSSPQLWRMPREFYQFVETQPGDLLTAYPHLLDLLNFEWTEIEVFMMPDSPRPTAAELSERQLIVNADHRMLELEYPVFDADADWTDLPRGKYYLLVVRHPEALDVRFVELSAVYAAFFRALAAPESTVDEALSGVPELELDDEESLSKFQDFLALLVSEGAIYNFSSTVEVNP